MTDPFSDDSGGLGGMLDKMPSIDALTILVLGFDAYMLYTQLDYYNRDAIFQITTSLPVVAFQATVVLILIYAAEFMHDRKGDGHR